MAVPLWDRSSNLISSHFISEQSQATKNLKVIAKTKLKLKPEAANISAHWLYGRNGWAVTTHSLPVYIRTLPAQCILFNWGINIQSNHSKRIVWLELLQSKEIDGAYGPIKFHHLISLFFHFLRVNKSCHAWKIQSEKWAHALRSLRAMRLLWSYRLLLCFKLVFSIVNEFNIVQHKSWIMLDCAHRSTAVARTRTPNYSYNVICCNDACNV